MKKLILTLILCVIFTIICPGAYAQSEDDDFAEIKDQISQELKAASDDDTADILKKEDISVENPDSVSDFSIISVFSELFDIFKSSLRTPIVMLGKITAISLVYAALKCMYLDSSPTDKAFGTICVLVMIIVMSDSVSSSIGSLKSSIENINNFMISYIPIFTAVTAAGGHTVTAGSYSAATLLVCEAAAFVVSKIMMPVVSAVLALTIISAINPQLKFAGIAESFKKLTVWLLATVMMIFLGLMSIQGITGASADNLAAKTIRLAASSIIPVIGGSVSEAYTAVKGSMGVIRSATGSIGILIIFFMAIKPFIAVLTIKAAVWTGKVVNELLGLSDTAEFLKSINYILSIGISILIAFSTAFIISTAAVMSAAAGGI